jgi:AbiV family abortive infection protein
MKGALFSFSRGLYASALVQAILAMEEQGRKLILCEAYIDGVELDEEWWRIMFRDHRSKIALLATAYFVTKEQRKWRKTLRRMGSQYQTLKEHAMYVTYDLQRNRWIHPGSITEKKALAVLKEAKSFLAATDELMSD